MKTKVFLFLAACALVTLSFSFVSQKKAATESKTSDSTAKRANEPSGGFSSEDKM